MRTATAKRDHLVQFRLAAASTGWRSARLLALISSGLTIIYGTLGVLNLAHGAMFMLGGYAGYVAYQRTGSFILAVIAGSLFVVVVGVLMERVIIRHFYAPSARRPDPGHLRPRHRLRRGWCGFFFGSLSKAVPPPPLGSPASRSLGFMFYPTYRIALLGIAAVALLALYIVLYRTRLGMIVRAGIEDSVMVDSLGIDVYRVFMLVFGIGAMAAGFAGIVNAPVVSLTPDMRRRDPGADLRRRGDRRRRLVPRRRSSAA